MTVHTTFRPIPHDGIAGGAYFVCTAYETIVNMRLNLSVVNRQCLAYRASGLWLGHEVNNCIPKRQIAVCTVSHQTLTPFFFSRVKGVA